jgi:hypothetical protein
MIPFFRTLRQRLLTENKLSKYLLYAIGEIVLVVIGILIALQINNWNEWRKERVKEREVLYELKENLERNVSDLQGVLERARRFNNSRNIVFSALENKSPYNDSLAEHFLFGGMGINKPSISRSGYEMLQNQGFEIIQSITLRQQIVELFESTYPRFNEKLSTTNINPLLEDLTRYFRTHFTRLDNPFRRIPLDYAMLLEDNYLAESLKAIAYWEDFLIQDNSLTLEESQRVLQQINQELTKQ